MRDIRVGWKKNYSESSEIIKERLYIFKGAIVSGA